MYTQTCVSGSRIVAPLRQKRNGQKGRPCVRVAVATPNDSIDVAVDSVVSALKAGAGVIKDAGTVLGEGAKTVTKGYEQVAPVVKQSVDTVAPVVSSGANAVSNFVGPAIKAASPSVSKGLESVGKSVDDFLTQQGVNPAVVKDTVNVTAKTTTDVVKTTTPVVESTFKYLTSADPATLVIYAAIAGAVLYFSPSLLGAVAGGFRGYAGEVTAPSALDAICTDSNSYLLDLRTQKEKEQSGVPDIPPSASGRFLELAFSATENKKIRNQLRNANDVETQMTAIMISNLKKLNKGNNIYLLDRYCDVAKNVAKALASKGFSNVYIISGGFDGRGGWSSSRLSVRPISIVSSRDFFAGNTVSSQKALPGGR